MGEFNKRNEMPENWKQKLFLGVEIPLPWLIGIVAALLFNAGIFYTQFGALKEQVKETADLVKNISNAQNSMARSQDRTDLEVAKHEAIVNDHESRIRNLERKR